MSRKRLFLFAIVAACAAVLVYAVVKPRGESDRRETLGDKQFGQEAQGVSLKGFSDFDLGRLALQHVRSCNRPSRRVFAPIKTHQVGQFVS